MVKVTSSTNIFNKMITQGSRTPLKGLDNRKTRKRPIRKLPDVNRNLQARSVTSLIALGIMMANYFKLDQNDLQIRPKLSAKRKNRLTPARIPGKAKMTVNKGTQVPTGIKRSWDNSRFREYFGNDVVWKKYSETRIPLAPISAVPTPFQSTNHLPIVTEKREELTLKKVFLPNPTDYIDKKENPLARNRRIGALNAIRKSEEIRIAQKIPLGIVPIKKFDAVPDSTIIAPPLRVPGYENYKNSQGPTPRVPYLDQSYHSKILEHNDRILSETKKLVPYMDQSPAELAKQISEEYGDENKRAQLRRLKHRMAIQSSEKVRLYGEMPRNPRAPENDGSSGFSILLGPKKTIPEIPEPRQPLVEQMVKERRSLKEFAKADIKPPKGMTQENFKEATKQSPKPKPAQQSDLMKPKIAIPTSPQKPNPNQEKVAPKAKEQPPKKYPGLDILANIRKGVTPRVPYPHPPYYDVSEAKRVGTKDFIQLPIRDPPENESRAQRRERLSVLTAIQTAEKIRLFGEIPPQPYQDKKQKKKKKMFAGISDVSFFSQECIPEEDKKNKKKGFFRKYFPCFAWTRNLWREITACKGNKVGQDPNHD